MIIPILFYIVTCGSSDKKFVKFITESYLEAKSVRCAINRPTTIYSWDGVDYKMLPIRASKPKKSTPGEK